MFQVTTQNRVAARSLLVSSGLPASEVRAWTLDRLRDELAEAVRAGKLDADKVSEFLSPSPFKTRDNDSADIVTPVKRETKAETGANDVQAAVADALSKALGPVFAAMSRPSVTREEICEIIAQEVPKHVGAFQRFEIVHGEQSFKIEGVQHKAFPKLLRAVTARMRHDGGALNIWLYGPAGTGKSTAARKLAEALNMDFHTNGPIGSQWDLRGFVDAQGRIVDTAFRRAWINGGVYCWDEGDGSAPAALIEANGALATGFASFPDGVFPRHKGCIIIINGNLRPGAAPDATYNGRFKQDTAFVNRFIAIEWSIDEDLEEALIGSRDEQSMKWLRRIRQIRQRVEERGIKGVVVSPRQTQYGLSLLDAGASFEEAEEMTVKWMFTPEQWQQVAA